jgi:hypothetical protein
VLENLTTNPIAWLILSLVTVLSFVYAIYTQITNKERKELTYAQKTDTLIYNKEKSFEKISVFYDDKPIENLYVSKIAIWNSGNRVLKKADFVKNKLLKISLEDNCDILESNIIMKTEETNAFKLSPKDDKEILVDFDYAEKDDGIVLQLIHTGEKNDINLSCKIIEGQPIKKYSKENSGLHKKRDTITKILFGKIFNFLMCIFYLLFSAFMMTVGIWGINNPQSINQKTVEELQKTNFQSAISLIVTGIIILLSTLYLIYNLTKKNYLGMPAKLRKVYNEEEE